MRFSLTLTAALLASTAAFADDIVIRADIAEATVFLSGAEITRRGTITVPAGTHRLLIAMPDAAQADGIDVSGPEGLSFGPPQLVAGHVIAEGSLDDPEQAAARAAVEAAEDAVQQAQDDLTAADATLRALEAQLSYLSALARGGPEGATMPADPATLPQLLATLGAETGRVQGEILAAQVARRDLARALTDRQAELSAASAELARLSPFGTAVDAIEVTLRAPSETEGEVVVDYLSYNAGWEPAYELHLDSETGALDIERYFVVYTSGGLVWRDVSMTFDTAEPTRQRSPSDVFPTPARIVEPAPPAAAVRLGTNAEFGIADAAPEPAVILEDTAAMVGFDGLSVRYSYAQPVSIGPEGETVLRFDSLTLDTETEARAAPRRDTTAFLVSMGRNETGEPILPGYATFFRDGALIGEDVIDMIPDGAELELAFGPLDHLRLIWIDRTLAEGDRGVFTSSNTQERAIAFGVENTSGTAEVVRLIYATPFSEQEDLELELTLAPAPDARDIDDLRGVHAWDLTVEPGETRMIEMGVALEWPEGQILTWWP